MRILVADDDPRAAGILAEFLTDIGHEVQVAHDGQEALTVANSFHPTVAFLDIEMPFFSGYEVARGLRQSPSTSHAVLAAITGLPSENEAKARDAGFDHFFMKPVDLARIEALLENQA